MYLNIIDYNHIKILFAVKMKLIIENETKNLKDYNKINNKDFKKKKKLNKSKKVLIFEIFLFISLIFISIYIINKEINLFSFKNSISKNSYKPENFNENLLNNNSIMSSNINRNIIEKKKINLGRPLKVISEGQINSNYNLLKFESNLIFLSEINKKRNFNKRYPLPQEIKCFEHIREGGLKDMLAFISFLTKDTIFFEFGSGCTSVIAKYFSKKSYAVEGNKNWYEEGIKNGLQDNLIFKDIKAIPIGNLWSEPGKDSNIEDWKNYFQAYKEEYNADVIFIDGRFRVACAFDIFKKIRNDTLVLIHEYFRPPYIAIGEYYDYIYHWDSIYLFKKKSNIKEIPIDVQKKFWSDST